MFKYLFIVLLSFTVLSSNQNIVKTSELELFLFKVGFESLLKDVDITKDKSTLNTQEIKSINEKIELIMSELYKDKRVLLKDSSEVSTVNSDELNSMKKEISILQKEILLLKEKKEKKEIEKVVTIEKVEPREIQKTIIENEKKLKAIVIVKKARIRSYPSIEAQIISELSKNEIIYLDYCDKFGWCKFKGRNGYIAQHILWIYKNQ